MNRATFIRERSEATGSICKRNQVEIANLESKTITSMNFKNAFSKMDELQHKQDKVELGDVQHGEVYKNCVQGFNDERVTYQYCEIEYKGRDAYFSGFLDGEEVRHGPGTVAWRVINSMTG